MTGGGGGRVKCAPTAASASSVSSHVCPVHAPLKPPKVAPESAIACSETLVPLVNRSVQAARQSCACVRTRPSPWTFTASTTSCTGGGGGGTTSCCGGGVTPDFPPQPSANATIPAQAARMRPPCGKARYRRAGRQRERRFHGRRVGCRLPSL